MHIIVSGVENSGPIKHTHISQKVWRKKRRKESDGGSRITCISKGGGAPALKVLKDFLEQSGMLSL